MSTEQTASDPDENDVDIDDIETEHPLRRFARQHFGPLADIFGSGNRYKIRRGIEAGMLVVLALGLVWWAIELFVIGGINV